MPRSKEQFEAMRQATHDKIVSAAGALFAKKGLGGTNVQEIADLAGISIGLLYRHYKTKEALFEALVNEASAGLVEVTRMLRSGGPPAEVVRGFCKEVVADVEAGDDFNNTILFITQAIAGETHSEAIRTLFRRDREMFAAWQTLIERGQREGGLRQGDPYDLAIVFCSALQGISQFKLLFGTEYRPPSAEALCAILLV